jgi:hypothetical protein
MNTLFLSIRKHYTTLTMSKKELIRGELMVAPVRNEGECLTRSAPSAAPGAVNMKSRASTILKTFRTSVVWKRKNIPSFEVIQGNSSSRYGFNNFFVPNLLSPDSSADTAGADTDELSTAQVFKLQAILPASSTIQTMASIHLPSLDGSTWPDEDTLTQSPPTSGRKIVDMPVIDSPLSQGSDWTQEEDITIRVDAHLQIVQAVSSALLEARPDPELSPLSGLAAYYESASISQPKPTASITSESSSVFLKAMSSSDFNLAHEEIFGLLPQQPRTPKT